ncbi:globin [Vibrio sp. D404a]|uniref:globin n=1 Tax=unclassified Vibrio TaxID=2614977 RepID=UPI0025545036|nr:MULTISPECIES: globin [unclassified Vibrio]MDK9737126.1 globin [Vibrio sp. D404a]MDK9798191.1 globin [Vibrio sp. D449a]
MEHNERFYESFERCRIDQEFLESFLADFCEHNPRFSERFANVGLEQQTKMLKASIILIYNSSGLPSVRNSVKRLGKQHKDLGMHISEQELNEWFQSLLNTVKKFDPHYDAQVEQAWTETLDVGLKIMKQECVVK